jgi:hypothetical protein
MQTLPTPQIHVTTPVCTLYHEFGGLTVPDFQADASLLEILHMVLMQEWSCCGFCELRAGLAITGLLCQLTPTKARN